jgi:hypothetical protein
MAIVQPWEGPNVIDSSSRIGRADNCGSVVGVWPTSVEGSGMLPVHDRWHMAGAFCARGVESTGARFSNLS